ncbi:hypothetical protein [Deinococcus hopiensis]|uniref:Uncharacterized protein n=1 Tax=Deinococcus hopiensis KR-140 TaxID=695939 RepID=A0A1W1ULA2_9DEIO|nr:hypothetical protein [Deinococcus hopiensis]SMB81876.1 hypothetical protein SAMN00790413_04755 [Deinococcus hopiensis KR-140]
MLEITSESTTWDEAASGRISAQIIEAGTWQEHPATWPEVVQGLAPTFQQRPSRMTDRLDQDIQDWADQK